jgi:C_GCAxxG_C_C family probable redox protein
MSLVDQAVSRFEAGFACSQSVFSTYSYLLDLSPEVAVRVAEPFGGGIASLGLTCGAVTGALMVIGLKHGRTEADDVEAREKTRELARQLVCEFEARNGTIVCRKLLDCDIGTPEGLASAEEQNLFETRCPRFVRDAAEIVEQLIPECRSK